MGARLVAAVVLLVIPGCSPSQPPDETLTVFAAASLRDLVDDLVTNYEGLAPEAVFVNLAGSNVLARQILAAPESADVLLSADEPWIEELERASLLATEQGRPRPFLANRLVAVVHRDSSWQATDAGALVSLPFRRLVLADPEAVPAGRYARAYLRATGEELWRQLEGRIVPTLDVRAATALVAADPDAIGIVYRTDAVGHSGVRVLHEFSYRPELPIVYWAAVLAGARNPAAAVAFVDYLGSEQALALADRHGFEAPDR